MKDNKIELNIETLILVAIWEKPFIFQGYFNITNKKDYSKKKLVFRCECSLQDKDDIIENEFSPGDYQFTHLHNVQSAIGLRAKNEELGLALYLLKFAVNETLKKIIIHPKQYALHMDDVALASITRQMESQLFYRQEQNLATDDIGFSVAIDFIPTEEQGRKAAFALLGLTSSCVH